MHKTFSIVIPTYGRPEALVDCLESLRALTGPSFEVIVVDDGSPAALDEAVLPFRDALNLTLLRQENAGPGAARNRGASAAKGTYLAFTDDDCRPDPGWLAAYETVLSDHPPALAGGPVRNGLPGNLFAAASQDITLFLYDTDRSDRAFFSSNNIACTKEMFEKVGGFDAGLRTSEDRDLAIRWRASGGITVKAPHAVVQHFHNMTGRGFWRQQVSYGQGAKHLSAKLERTGLAEPITARGLGFYRDLFLAPYRIGGRGRPVRALLIALSHLPLFVGYVR
jgi:glycosyltransferase involved in cell wall biosynthesis